MNPDPSRIPEARLERVAQALITPVQDGPTLPYGVYRGNGSFCQDARTMLGGPRFTGIPEGPPPETAEALPGRHLFGGLARVHFGHFLVESIARLWAIERLDAPVDSIVFLPMPGRRVKAPFGAHLSQIVAILCGPLPLRTITGPMRAEELIVPSQGVGHLAWSTGTPEFRHFVRSRFERHYKANGPEKLYISRARLEKSDKLVDKEAQIEAIMEHAGYTIFHPERHSIREQAEHYMAARMVVGADGSAFHFAAHLFQPGARIGLIKRRHRTAVFGAIAEQIKAFGEVSLATLHPLMEQEEGEDVAPLNLHRLERALRRKGFV